MVRLPLPRNKLLFAAFGLASVASAEDRPPAQLYHYGPRVHLLRDVSARTVPPADWNEVIMGGDGEFASPTYRRGLYGCPNLAAGDAYAAAPDSWVIRIKVKDACRQPGQFTSIDWMHPDQKFKSWIAKAPGLPFRLAAYNKRCVENGEMNISSEFGGENPCNKIAQRYLADSRFKVVYDHNAPTCWYVRDRSCIETIEGTPSEVLSFVVDWKPGAHSPNTLRVAVSALARLASYSYPVLAKLEAQANKGPEHAALAKLVGALRNCGKSPRQTRAAQAALQSFYRQLDPQAETGPELAEISSRIQQICGGGAPTPSESSPSENEVKSPAH